MRTFIRARRGSASARELSGAMGVPMIRTRNSRYSYRPGDRIIVWGNSKPVRGVPMEAYSNPPAAIAAAVDKQLTWDTLRALGISTVEYTTEREEAEQWLRDGSRVMARYTLTGSGGKGIEVYSLKGSAWTGDWAAMAAAPRPEVWVKVFGRAPSVVEEYRIHVVDDSTRIVQKKRRRTEDGTKANPYIRNHEGGWVFCSQNVAPVAPLVTESAIQGLRALGLRHGAVDLATSGDEYCIYEINTSPGLEGSTIEWYSSLLSV